MALDAACEHPDHPLLIAREPVVVGRSERHGITVGREHPPARERACVVVSFALKRLRHLLRHHATAENPGESVPDHTLQPTLEPLRLAHGDLRFQVRAGLPAGCPDDIGDD